MTEPTTPTGRKPRDVRDFIRLYGGRPTKLSLNAEQQRKLLEIDFGELEARVMAWHKEMRK